MEGGYFTENLGQWGPHASFVAQSGFGHVVFGTSGVTYDVATENGGHRVRVAFLEAGTTEPIGLGVMGFLSNYFFGNDPKGWVTGARSYRELLYRAVWPNIDVRYRFSGGALKYDVLIGSDADPSMVRFDVEGHKGLEVNDNRLDIHLSEGQALHDVNLVAWYEDGEAVDVSFRRAGSGFGFEVDKEPGRALVIDPVIVHASTFVGGTYEDSGQDVDVDSDGNIYITGFTGSSDYPVTPGAYSETLRYYDVFVTKLNDNCSKVIWSTFLGGTSNDFINGIEVDDEDNVFVMGSTWSSDFPVTPGAFQTLFNIGVNNYGPDLWVTKIKAEGDRLEYSTYVGGSGPETAGDLKVWNGNATVVGWTDSKDFRTDSGYYAACHGDAILFMLNDKGTAIVAFQYWGGFSSEMAIALEFDRYGDVIVGGRTNSMDFYTTPGVFQRVRPSGNSGFVSKYSPSEKAIIFSTYLGGSSDWVSAITMDEDLNIYAAGSSFWSGPGVTFPVTPGAFDVEYNGRTEGFVCKMDPDGTSLIYSTLLGGDGRDYIQDIKVDIDGNAVVAGSLGSGGNYTVTPGCHDPDWSGEGEGFIFVLDGENMEPVYSSFHGGAFVDGIGGMVIDDLDNLVLTGWTESRDFPVKEDGFQTRPGGYSDAFVSIIGEPSPPTAPRNLTATGCEFHIILDWELPLHHGDYPLRSYLVYRGTSEDDLVFHNFTDGMRNFVDLEVEVGVDYYYAVFATNGKGTSPPSNVATARAYTLPDPPVNLTATVNLDSVTLEWEHPVFTGGLPLLEYRLFRSVNGGSSVLHTRVSPDLRAYEDADVRDGTKYTYELASANHFKQSVANPSITLRTHAVPTPPRDLAHTYGDTFINLTWEPPEDDYDLPITAYRVYRLTGEGHEELIGVIGPTIPALVDTEVEIGTLYTYLVTAVNAKGESDPSEGITAKAMVPPDPPTEVEAWAGEHFVRVTWSPPPFDGASPILGYRVYLGKDPEDAECLGIVNVQGLDDPRLVFLHDVPYDGVPRHYFVTAVNAEGESRPSALAATTVYELPGPPLDIVVGRGDGQLTVSWDPPASDGGAPVLMYTLYRREGPEGGFTERATLAVGVLRFLDDITLNGVGYTYRVTASNLVGEGDHSTEVSAVPAGPPDPPAGITAEGLNGSARVTWEPPAWAGGLPVSGYRVYIISRDLQEELLVEVGADVLEHLVGELENGQVYLYAVRTLTEAGESAISEIAEVRPMGPPMAPRSLAAFWVDDHVQLTWSAPASDGGSQITGYWLLRDDWVGGNWTELSALELSFVDIEVEPGRTYTYIVYAINGVDRGPAQMVTIIIPIEKVEPAEPTTADVWMYLLLVLALVGLGASLYYVWRNGKGPDGPGEHPDGRS